MAASGEEADPTDRIPDKAFFRIGEVARLVGVKPFVLRFWEREFADRIRPSRNRGNQRLYQRRDVKVFMEIKHLRYGERLQVKGAKRRLHRGDGGESGLAVALRFELESLLRMIDEDEAGG